MRRFVVLMLCAMIAEIARAECDINAEADRSITSLKERLTCVASELAILRAEVDILRNIETENEILRGQLDALRKSMTGEPVLRVTKSSRDLKSYSFPTIRTQALKEMEKHNAKLVQEGNQWMDFELNGFPVMLACRTYTGSTCDVTVVGPGPGEENNHRVADGLRDLILGPESTRAPADRR